MIYLQRRQTKSYKTDIAVEVWRVVACQPAASSPAPSGPVDSEWTEQNVEMCPGNLAATVRLPACVSV